MEDRESLLSVAKKAINCDLRHSYHAMVTVQPNGRYFSDFGLTSGQVGKLRSHYKVKLADNAVADICARVFGHASEEINGTEAKSPASPAGRLKAYVARWIARSWCVIVQ
jgi:hypothetical protein